MTIRPDGEGFYAYLKINGHPCLAFDYTREKARQGVIELAKTYEKPELKLVVSN